MSMQKTSNMNYFKVAFQSALIFAICIAIFESFQITISTSIRYMQPWDVFVITMVLCLAYSVIWSATLISIAFLSKFFWQKRDTSEGALTLIFCCIALFLYELFWISHQAVSKELINSSYGIFLLLAEIILAALIAYGAFKILELFSLKGYFQQTRLKLFVFVFSMIAYMMTYIYFKSASKEGFLKPVYSISLFVAFVIFYKSLIYLIKKLKPILKFSNLLVITTRIKFLIFMAVVFVSLIFSYFPHSLAKKTSIPSGPNILFISIDTLRADHLSCYNEINKKTSPNIDRIAQSGYLFKRAYSPTSWTLPAHASMMTGLFPSSHNADRSFNLTVGRPVDPLPSSALTLAEVLNDEGYLTAGIISNPFVSSSFGMQQGFEFYDDELDLFLLHNLRYFHLKDHTMLFVVLRFFKIIDNNDYDNERDAPEVNEKALNWLKKNKHKTNPFFLFLHYNEPHSPYDPPEPYNKSDDGRNLDYFYDIEKLLTGQFSLTTSGLNDLIACYDGEITYVDYHLGLLFNKLSEWNILDNTLIIITSDHGESFNEHEIWQHGNSLYEEQIRVPLIIHYPKLFPNSRIFAKHIVQLVDLMPTILDILGIPIPDIVQGRSLLPILKGEPEAKFDLAFAEIKPSFIFKAKNPKYGDGIKTVINNEWKYILYDNGKEELYNLNVDPGEKDNLTSREKIKVNTMKKILNTWFNAVTRKKDIWGDRATEKIDSGILEQLRTLGYLK